MAALSLARTVDVDFPISVPETKALHPALVSAINGIVGRAKAQEQPFLLHMAGVPGAGKSSLAEALLGILSRHEPNIVGFDRLMEVLPEYQEAQDSKAAFVDHELTARAAGYALIKNLMEKRANIIFDHSAANASHVDLLRYAKEIGYRVLMVRVVAPTDAAKQRIIDREHQEGRHTPPAYVDDRAKILDALLGQYRAIVHHFIEVQNAPLTLAARAALFAATAEKIATELLAA